MPPTKGAQTPATEYNVQVEWRIRADDHKTINNAAADADAVIERLEGHSPAVSRSPYGWLEAWFTLPAIDLRQALTTAYALATSAVPGVEVIALQVMPTDEFDRRNSDGTLASLITEASSTVSATEAAELLGISGQAIRSRLRNGTLPGEQIGRDWRIPRTAIDALRKEREAAREAATTRAELRAARAARKKERSARQGTRA